MGDRLNFYLVKISDNGLQVRLVMFIFYKSDKGGKMSCKCQICGKQYKVDILIPDEL